MAGTSLLILIDDIAALLDDVSIMTKVAVKKTAGVLGDDLSINAEQVSGVNATREIPVVCKVAVGSLINKIILVPLALLISYFFPNLIAPILMIGGAFLCFEGAEKIYHYISHLGQNDTEEQAKKHKESLTNIDMLEYEKDKIKGALRTDFILSAEIITISLGTIANETLIQQALVLALVSLIVTFGVYGLVGIIVKLDDLGFYLINKRNQILKAIGIGLINFAPKMMKFLSITGTTAMFLVGGGIISHNIPNLHHIIESLNLPSVFETIMSVSIDLIIGFFVGFVVLFAANLLRRYKL